MPLTRDRAKENGIPPIATIKITPNGNFDVDGSNKEIEVVVKAQGRIFKQLIIASAEGNSIMIEE